MRHASTHVVYLGINCAQFDVHTVSKYNMMKQGITYSVMSASWDDDREGSGGLGIDEFKKNVGSIKEGLSRTKENALFREKMAGLTEEEGQRAIDDAERREKAKKTER